MSGTSVREAIRTLGSSSSSSPRRPARRTSRRRRAFLTVFVRGQGANGETVHTDMPPTMGGAGQRQPPVGCSSSLGEVGKATTIAMREGKPGISVSTHAGGDGWNYFH